MGRRFVVRAKENGGTHARLGVIAARKAIPRAVDRIRCKRLVREVFRAAQPMPAALDIVVLCRKAVARREQAAGREELADLFATVGESCSKRPTASKP